MENVNFKTSFSQDSHNCFKKVELIFNSDDIIVPDITIEDGRNEIFRLHYY